MNERFAQFAGRLMGELGAASFPTEIIHAQNLEKAKEHLKNGSLLVYANHLGIFDILVFGKVIRDNISILSATTLLMAMKYKDPEREEHKKIGKLLYLLRAGYGFRLLPIVQDTNEEKERYPDFKTINAKTFLQAVRALRTPGNIVIIAPEGTRSQDGQLLEAKDSFETLLKPRLKNGEVEVGVLALPLAGVPPIRSLHRTRVFVGQPFTYGEIKSESEREGKSVTELAMLRIANLLPEQNRGFYRQI